MRYDAFISYRHSPLDMEIAKKVHTGLETYKIPKAVQQKTGKKKIKRVFRDQEELPIGSDLDDNIDIALTESEFLIVICSPRTPESVWVCKEIESCIQKHDRDNVLAVLIEGEPEDSFPHQLRFDEAGNIVEPLAADVRGADKKERDKKFKTEILRLAASVIGCTYDELRQRHRERMIRRTVTLASSAAGILALAGTAFGIYNANVAQKMTLLAQEKSQLAEEKSQLADEKTRLADEITLQYQGKQQNQSRFYSEEALTLLKNGNREDAVLVAMEGLPSENNPRPYVPEAEYALSKALYAYECQSGISYDRNLTHSLPVKDLLRADNGNRLTTIDSGNRVYVWDTNTWEKLCEIEPQVSKSNSYDTVESADADENGVFINTEKEVTKYDFDGNVVFKKEFEQNVVQVRVCCKDTMIVVTTWDYLYVLDSQTGEEIASFPNETDCHLIKGGRYMQSTNLFFAYHYTMDGDHTYCTILDLENMEAHTTQLKNGYVLDFCSTTDGNFAVLCSNSDLLTKGVTSTTLELLDREGNRIWDKKVELNIKSALSFETNLRSNDYEEGGKTKTGIVLTVESSVFAFDAANGELISQFNLPAEASALMLSNGIPYARIGYKTGNIDFIDYLTGKIYPEYAIETGDSIRDVAIFPRMILFNSYRSNDVHVMSWHEASDIEEYLNLDNKIYPVTISPDSSYYALRPNSDYNALYFYDKDGKLLFTYNSEIMILDTQIFNDHTVVLTRNYLANIDPVNQTVDTITFKDLGLNDTYGDFSFTNDGYTASVWTTRSGGVIDIKNKKLLYPINDCEKSIEKITVSDDLSTIYVSLINENLFAIDIASDKKNYFKGDKLVSVANTAFDHHFMALSPDNNYIAMSCKDGYVRVATTKTLEVVAEIPMDSYLNAYVTFTDDSAHLVMQGDDYRIIVWDLYNKTTLSTMDVGSKISHITCDDDDNLMAVCFGQGVLLFETETYGCVAESIYGLLYLKDDNSILVSFDEQVIKKTHYKNYSALIEDAKKQFPGAELSEEKKIKYNIN